VETSDSITLIPGCPVPVILRKLEPLNGSPDDCSDNRYSLVGVACVASIPDQYSFG
jgi:hypothetical protein